MRGQKSTQNGVLYKGYHILATQEPEGFDCTTDELDPDDYNYILSMLDDDQDEDSFMYYDYWVQVEKLLDNYEVCVSDDGYSLIIRDWDWSEQYVFRILDDWAEGRGDRHLEGDTENKIVYCGDSSGVPASSKPQDTTEEIPEYIREVINEKTDYEIADKYHANWSPWNGRPEFSEFKIVLAE